MAEKISETRSRKKAKIPAGYVDAGEVIIMDILGWGRAFHPEGVSLNQLHLALNRLRETPQRVNYYQLRDLLKVLERKEMIATCKVQSWTTYVLFDWEGWWRLRA